MDLKMTKINATNIVTGWCHVQTFITSMYTLYTRMYTNNISKTTQVQLHHVYNHGTVTKFTFISPCTEITMEQNTTYLSLKDNRSTGT